MVKTYQSDLKFLLYANIRNSIEVYHKILCVATSPFLFGNNSDDMHKQIILAVSENKDILLSLISLLLLLLIKKVLIRGLFAIRYPCSFINCRILLAKSFSFKVNYMTRAYNKKNILAIFYAVLVQQQNQEELGAFSSFSPPQ